MKKIQLIPIEFPALDAFIHYFIESDRTKAQEYFKKRFEYNEPLGSGLTWYRDCRDPIVWMSSKKPDIVVHEMIHAIIGIFTRCGHNKITNDNEELFAYHVDYAVKQILK